jgi:GT2 family glycosyltransferase
MAVNDVLNVYRLFLGRVPETERVLQNRATAPLSKMLREFAASKEFSERVLRPLASGYPLPHFRISAVPDPEIIAWAAALPLGAPTRTKISTARTWREVLTQIVCDPEFQRNFGRPFDEHLLPLVRKRQASATPETGEREIVGGVDETAIFEIRGWAANLLNLDESLALEFYLDNLFVGVVHTQHFRRDMQERLGGAGNVGFHFNVPAVHHPDLEVERLLTVRDAISRLPIAAPVRVRLAQTEALDSLFRLHKEVEALAAGIERLQAALPRVLSDTEYPLAMYNAYYHAARNQLMANRLAQSEEAAALTYQPSFSVVLSGKGQVPSQMIASINSLRRQTYRNWECVLCIPLLDDEVRSQLETLSSNDTRIRVIDVSSEMEPWEKGNVGLVHGTGDYITWLNEGDLLTADALFEVSRVLQDKKQGLIYFDEDIFEGEGQNVRYVSPILKTAFDHDLLLAANYLENAFVCPRRAAEEAGHLRGEFGAAFYYDFVFRLLERLNPDDVLHVERILYHRRDHSSFDEIEKGIAGGDLAGCANAHLQRIGSAVTVQPHDDPYGVAQPHCRRVFWPLPDRAPLVSIVIPTRDRADLMRPCLQSVWDSQKHYPGRLELIIMDNDSCEAETHQLFERATRELGAKVIPFQSAFNWSAINNLAAHRAEGDILLFLNNDTQVLTPDWIRELVSNAIRPEVGAVGARLLYEDGTIQHGGVVLGGRAAHEGVGQRPTDSHYLGRTALQRNVSAVTGACLCTRKDLFLELGGFDEMNLKVAFNDIDYCLKVRSAGLSVIYTPFATLYHFESKSRGLDNDFAKRLRSQNEFRIMRARWGSAIECDPYYNSRFNRTGRPFSRLRSQQVMSMPVKLQDDEQELWEQE